MQVNLSIFQVIEAFPEECIKILPRELKRLKKELKPYFNYVKSVKLRHLERSTEKFLLLSAPNTFEVDTQKYREYGKLTAYKRLMRIQKAWEESMNPKEGNRITEKDIQTAKDIPIQSVHDFGQVKRSMVCCPFHEDRSPSMKINTNNTVKCFSCGFFGDTISFIKKLNGLNFVQAVKHLLNKEK